MAKISINEAAKRFHVSRPTLLKHLKSGYVSGEKDDGKAWKIDTSELARVFQARSSTVDKQTTEDLPTLSSSLQDELLAENERLKTQLAVAEALAAERGKRLDQLAPLLTDQRTRRRWWPF